MTFINFKKKDASVIVSNIYTYGTDRPKNSYKRDIEHAGVIEISVNQVESELRQSLVVPEEFKMLQYVALGITREEKYYSIRDFANRKLPYMNSNGNGFVTQKQMEEIIYGHELATGRKERASNLYIQSASYE